MKSRILNLGKREWIFKWAQVNAGPSPWTVLADALASMFLRIWNRHSQKDLRGSYPSHVHALLFVKSDPGHAIGEEPAAFVGTGTLHMPGTTAYPCNEKLEPSDVETTETVSQLNSIGHVCFCVGGPEGPLTKYLNFCWWQSLSAHNEQLLAWLFRLRGFWIHCGGESQAASRMDVCFGSRMSGRGW